MFGLGFGEIAVILVLALLIFGPKKLPDLARGLGKSLREFRRATEDFRSTLDDEAYRGTSPSPSPSRPASADRALPQPGEVGAAPIVEPEVMGIEPQTPLVAPSREDAREPGPSQGEAAEERRP